jgi:hypothetical protein
MRLWEGDLLSLPGTGKEAGWLVIMVLICLATFAVSSIFVDWGVRSRLVGLHARLRGRPAEQ